MTSSYPRSIEEIEIDGGKLVCFDFFPIKITMSEIWMRRIWQIMDIGQKF